MKRVLAHALLALSLAAACTTPKTVYAPAIKADATGYREQRIESDRYRVTFRANADVRPEGVEDFALRRAAEIATQNGAEWFRVVTRSTEQVGGQSRSGTSVGVGGSSGSFGSSVGVGVGINLSPDSRQYETRMEILLGRGPKPSDPNVYDARAILSRPATG